MSNETHAFQRVTERLSDLYDEATINKFYAVTKQIASRSTAKSEAIRLLVLPEQVGQKWGEQSNGNEVWAIVRNSNLVTIMLRRSTQNDSGLKCETVTRLG